MLNVYIRIFCIWFSTYLWYSFVQSLQSGQMHFWPLPSEVWMIRLMIDDHYVFDAFTPVFLAVWLWSFFLKCQIWTVSMFTWPVNWLTCWLTSQKPALSLLKSSCSPSLSLSATSSSSEWPCITSLTHLLSLTSSLSLLPLLLSTLSASLFVSRACGWRYYVGIDYAGPNTGWIYSSAAPSLHSYPPPLSELPPFLPLHPSFLSSLTFTSHVS